MQSQTDRIEQMKNVQKEALALFIKKNTDYGDAFAKYGVIGVLMRIEDKIQRCISITKSGVNLVNASRTTRHSYGFTQLRSYGTYVVKGINKD
jgi:hypothetical protein